MRQSCLHHAGTLGAAVFTALSAPSQAANQQTVLRFLCNSFQKHQLKAWLLPQLATLLQCLSEAFRSPAKAVRGPAAAFLLNVAIYAHSESLPSEPLQAVAQGIVELLQVVSPEELETLHRCDHAF